MEVCCHIDSDNFFQISGKGEDMGMKKSRIIKRMLAVVLCAAMSVSLMPTSSMAEISGGGTQHLK